jgi:hypothetical protein
MESPNDEKHDSVVFIKEGSDEPKKTPTKQEAESGKLRNS